MSVEEIYRRLIKDSLEDIYQKEGLKGLQETLKKAIEPDNRSGHPKGNHYTDITIEIIEEKIKEKQDADKK